MRYQLLVILLISYSSSFCQLTENNQNKYWGTFGFAGYEDGFGLGVSADYLKNRNYWKLRYIKVYEFAFEIFSHTEPYEKFYDIGLLYGRITNTKIVRFSISGGLGIFGGIKRGDFLFTNQVSSWNYINYYKENQIFSPSIPLEVGMNLMPLDIIGIGISGFANINFKKSWFLSPLNFS